MTNNFSRPPLSPAAQAVNHAYCKISYDQDVEPSFRPLPWEQKAIAAALRAAADHTEAESIWHGHPEHTGVRWAAGQWRSIAAELEG